MLTDSVFIKTWAQKDIPEKNLLWKPNRLYTNACPEDLQHVNDVRSNWYEQIQKVEEALVLNSLTTQAIIYCVIYLRNTVLWGLCGPYTAYF